MLLCFSDNIGTLFSVAVETRPSMDSKCKRPEGALASIYGLDSACFVEVRLRRWAVVPANWCVWSHPSGWTTACRRDNPSTTLDDRNAPPPRLGAGRWVDWIPIFPWFILHGNASSGSCAPSTGV